MCLCSALPRSSSLVFLLLFHALIAIRVVVAVTIILVIMTDKTQRIGNYRIPKIPPFWKNAPETWFIQVEASMYIARITIDRTKAG